MRKKNTLCSQILIGLIFFSLVIESIGQIENIKFDQITTENGLVQDHVFCILQDTNGFLWFGTESGLVRYDAYYFKVYQHDPNNPASISSNIIKAIHQDKAGYLWIGTDGGGLCRFDPETEQFLNFKNNPNQLNSLSGNRVYSIKEDQSGTLWVGTLGHGLNKLTVLPKQNNTNEYRFERFQSNPQIKTSLSNDNIWDMAIDRSNRLWIGTVAGGLDMLDLNQLDDKKSLPFKHFMHDAKNPGSISGNSIKSIYEAENGVLWVGTEFNGLNRLDSLNGDFQHFRYNPINTNSISHNCINVIIEDEENRLWLGTNGGGINVFYPDQGKITRFMHTPSDPFSLNGNLVNDLYLDKNGIIWIGLVIKGLGWIDPQKQQIQHYYPINHKPNSLKGELIKAIYEDRKKQIWIGAYGGGLSQFNPKNGQFKNYPNKQPNGSNVTDNNVQTIYEDQDNNFWIGTDGGGLYKFDQERGLFTEFNQSPSKSTSLLGNSVWAICEDLRGNLWIGTADGGLNLFDKTTQEFKHFKNNPNQSNGINSNDVRVIIEDHLGILWIGTYGGGLNRLNPTTEEFIHYKNNPNDDNSISNDIITTIYESPANHELWIGTFGGGLNRFNRISESFKAYRKQEGSPNDVVKSIEEDQEGNLWVSTLQGIGKFNPTNNAFVNYSTSDGLQNSFSLGTSCTTTDGAMYFGGTNGFNVFYPEKLKNSSNENAPCLITDLKIFNESIQPGEQTNGHIILPKAIHKTKEITIPHTIDNIAFEFAALDFARSKKIDYAFLLEGVDDNWQHTDAQRRYAAYSNLSWGEYIFKVKSTDKSGIWNSEVTSVKINIQQPPWRTWWAYLIYFGLLMLLIYLLKTFTLTRIKLFNQLKLERLERRKVREMNEMKFRFFTNISHEIRTPLTLILGPLETLISSAVGTFEIRKQLQTMHQNASRLLTLVNQLLEFREQESGHTKLRVAKGNIVKFMYEITLAFKEYALNKNISFSFTHDPTELNVWFDRLQLEKVIFNLLSNAFKFTPEGGKITVHISENKDKIKLLIEDNGKGISTAALPYIFDRFSKFDREYSGNYLGSGIGLALTKNLVELHQGTISVDSQPDQYTRFCVTLLKGVNHFKEEQIISDYKGSESAVHYQIATSNPILKEEDVSKQLKNKEDVTILIIEDNEDVRRYLIELFSATYFIIEAADGKNGLNLAIKESPDLIISDIMMPEMDGIELCRQLKAAIETSHIPIILLTARTSIVFRSEGLEIGADDYITKPFNPELLKKRVKNLIASRRTLREKFSQEIKIEPKEVTLSSPDTALLQKAIQIVEAHIDDSEFDVNTFAREIGMSRPVLYRKLPALTNYTPNEFIRVMRLKRAAQLLAQNVLSISEVCYKTGFNTPKYFSKCFREEFGMSPSEYGRKNQNKIRITGSSIIPPK